MTEHRADGGARRLGAPAQLEGEEHVGELALRVGRPLSIAALSHQVVPVHAPDAVHEAGDGDHTIADRGPGQRREREVTEVIDAELHLEPVLGLAPGDRHHARVVDQDVDAGVAELRSRVPDRSQGGEIEAERADLRARRRRDDVGTRLRDLVVVAPGEDRRRAPLGEHPRRFEADPGVGAGDREDPAAQVGDLVDRPLAHGRQPVPPARGASRVLQVSPALKRSVVTTPLSK